MGPVHGRGRDKGGRATCQTDHSDGHCLQHCGSAIPVDCCFECQNTTEPHGAAHCAGAHHAPPPHSSSARCSVALNRSSLPSTKSKRQTRRSITKETQRSPPEQTHPAPPGLAHQCPCVGPGWLQAPVVQQMQRIHPKYQLAHVPKVYGKGHPPGVDR